MTREQVLAMEPGDALDELVAERVMGWTRGADETCPWRTPKGYAWQVRSYSTDIAAAWTVVEKLRASGRWIEICENRAHPWRVWFGKRIEVDPLGGDDMGFASTLPLAICRASLLTTLGG